MILKLKIKGDKPSHEKEDQQNVNSIKIMLKLIEVRINYLQLAKMMIMIYNVVRHLEISIIFREKISFEEKR